MAMGFSQSTCRPARRAAVARARAGTPARPRNGLDGGIAESLLKAGPDALGIGRSFGGIARDHAPKAAPRLGQDGRDDAFGGDVADSNYDPVEHRFHGNRRRAGARERRRDGE